MGASEKVFEIPEFGGEFFRPTPIRLTSVTPSNPGFRHVGALFNLRGYHEENRPTVVGRITAEDMPFVSGQRVLDMPIKFPGSDYRVPAELAPYAGVIQAMIDAEETVNPGVADYHAYLTVDNARVPAGDTQRVPGLHVDGFQGARIPEPLPLDHSYICHSCVPTAFFTGPFDVAHMDTARENVFHAFDRQAAVEGMLPRTYPNYTVLFMDAYTVHASTLAPMDIDRTFVRLSYSVREYDRLGNSHNPAFDYCWDMVRRDIHTALAAAQGEAHALAG